MTNRIPTDNERRLHIAVITVAALVAVAMVGAAAWSLTRPAPVRTLPAPAITPAQETSASMVATRNVASSSTATVPATSAASTQTPTSSAEANSTSIVSAHKIAYRIDNALYVATEDGTGARPAYGQSANYALSPNGREVASIEGGKLAVVKVGTRPTSKAELVPGIAAEDVAPVWMPDSSAVLFVRTTGGDALPSVWSYSVSSHSVTKIGTGSGMAVSPDGQTVVGLPGDTDSSLLTVWRTDGRVYTVDVRSGNPVAVALANDRIFVSTDSSTSGDALLWSLSLDGKQRKRLVGATSAGSASATYGQLLLSPDGKRLMFTVEGDDGYSRIRVVPTAGGSSVAISGRRDGYPLGWTADSARILFVEGNAYQGQTTALWRSDAEGHNRKELVKRATI